MHLIGNIICQLVFGVFLELSHGSTRVGIIYLSGIFLGGVGREISNEGQRPLAGASGGMYALVAAHVSHLLLNWGNDSFVLVQRVTCSKEDLNTPRPSPVALPSRVSVKWIRLSVALLVLIFMSIDFGKPGTPASVSHAAHGFGALGGLLTGYIFLEARNKNRLIQIGKIVLLVLVYGITIAIVAYQYYTENSKDSDQICNWSDYERICQKKCYGANETESCEHITICKSSNAPANTCY